MSNLLGKLKNFGANVIKDAIEFLGENITLPLIYSRTDVVILKLKDFEISTSDGIGIGQQMTLKIRGVGFDMFNAVAEQHPPYTHGNPLTPGTLPYFPVLFSKKLPDTDAIIEYGQRDIELFILSVEPISTTEATFGSPPDSYKVILRVEIYEEDPTYDDQSTFTYTYYIPYRSEVIYQDLFEVTHFTSFNEGPIRKTVNVQFTFKFEYVLIKQFNEVELIIYTYRNHIKQAASLFPNVPASLVAAIIYDEIYHRDYFDDAQDYKSPLQINQNVLIEKFVEVIYEIKYEDNDDERTTLSVEGLKKLRRLDFQDIPGWYQDYFAASVKYLLDPTTAPVAVAANLQYLINIISSDSGVNVANNLEIVAHYYNAGYYVGSGTIDEDLSNGIEKIERMPRMEDILNLN